MGARSTRSSCLSLTYIYRLKSGPSADSVSTCCGECPTTWTTSARQARIVSGCASQWVTRQLAPISNSNTEIAVFRKGKYYANAMTEKETMKAVQIHAFGGPEVLQYEDVPQPQPKVNQILVRVHA